MKCFNNIHSMNKDFWTTLPTNRNLLTTTQKLRCKKTLISPLSDSTELFKHNCLSDDVQSRSDFSAQG